MPPFSSPQMPAHLIPPHSFRPPNGTSRPLMKQAGMAAAYPPPDLPRKPRLLPPAHRTNPAIWCFAVVCLVLSLLVILAGVAILVVFLVIKPRNPLFDVTNASLNGIYLDSQSYFNGDLTLLANFSNPNRQIDVMLEYVSIELYLDERPIAAQALQPISQRRGESSLEAVHMVSSEVYLPPDLTILLREQVRRNRIVYSIRGTFRVKASLGIGRFSYWLYGRCQIELTAPPAGVLVARNCRTKR